MNQKKPVLMDGGLGTSLWAKAKEQIPVWRYNLEQPALVESAMCAFADAGAAILIANTFSANRPSLAGSGYSVKEVVSAGMEIARRAADGKAQVALDVGPLPDMLAPVGQIGAKEARGYFEEQIESGLAQNPDLIFVETFMDVAMARIAAETAAGSGVPFFVSMSFHSNSPKKGPRTLMGDSIADILAGIADLSPAAIGLNCSTGPEDALPIIEEYARQTDIPLLFKPNAGKPLTKGGSQYDYRLFAKTVVRAATIPGVRYIGGCCGSSPQHIAALRDELDALFPAG